MTSDEDDGFNDVAAVVRLGLKLGLGKRGEYIAEFLDERRMRRAAGRVAAVGDSAEQFGLDFDALLERLESDDEAAEVAERVLEVATRARFEPKIRYLARCLANFAEGREAASPDMTLAKVAAVADLEAIHA